MATQHRAIEYLIERMAGAGAVSAESMFGKHGVYVNDKMIGLVCDDQLYLKAIASGRLHAKAVSEVSP